MTAQEFGQKFGKRIAGHSEGKRIRRTEADAEPQEVRGRHGRRNSGVSSAEPRVISGKGDGDATFPLEQDEGQS